MEETITIRKRDIWEAIWLDENTAAGKAADFLRAFLLPAPKAKVSTKGERRVAVVIGHNSRKTGAYAGSPVNKSEYQLNGETGDLMAERADSDPNIEIKVFRRKPISSYTAEIRECYRRVNAWDPEIVIELHFNWLGGAGRVEMVVFKNGERSQEIGRIFLEVGSKVFSGLKKLVKRGGGDRGGMSLVAAKAPCVLTEWWDCANAEHRRIAEELGPQGFARLYYEAIELCLGLGSSQDIEVT